MVRLSMTLLLVTAGAAGGETHRLAVTADAGICAHPNEVALNTGGNSRIRVKGNEHYYLFNFDAEPLRLSKVTKATLHVKLAGGHLRRVAFCTVPCPWTEGSAVNKPEQGAPCFTHVKYPTHTWPIMGRTDPPGGDTAHTGGTMLDATFNSPYMRWEASDVRAGKGGWLEIPIHPDLVQAVAAGLSHGLVMADEKGQTRENHDIFTREQANAQPYLIVEGQAVHVAATHALKRTSPKVEPWPEGASFRTGAIHASVGDPFPKAMVQSLGHRFVLLEGSGKTVREAVTFLHPHVVFDGLEPGREYSVVCQTFVGVQGHASEAVKVLASAALAVPEVPKPTTRPAEAWLAPYGYGEWAWQRLGVADKPDPAEKGMLFPLPRPEPAFPVPVTPRNAWVGFQLVVFAPEGRATGITVRVSEFGNPQSQRDRSAIRNEDNPARLRSRLVTRLYRAWHVARDGSPHAEVLVPLQNGEKFDIPWGANKVAGQVNQVIFVDIYVPPRVGPGRYNGRLVIAQDGKDVVEIPLAMEAADAILPDEFRIVADCNTYDSPARAMGVKADDPKAFMEMERKYYRLAHAHRMTLNVLPYSQSGSINWRGAPKINADGSLDFTEWDERYGPLLDGSAFSAKAGYVGPGEGVPIHHMYLPFHENWPAPLAQHFKPPAGQAWPPPKDYDAFLKWSADLPSIEECLDGTLGPYGWRWRDMLVKFVAYVHRRAGSRTRYHVYLNNKYYFRDPKQGGRGISLWLLDEPMFADDFLALRHFGKLVQSMRQLHVPTPGEDKVDFRIDISRPTHQRKWLDRLVDLNVCGGHLYEQRHFIAWRKHRFGEEYWNYRMPESFAGDNLAWALWPVRSYCWGATGTLPWQTIGSDGDLDAADATALMYPGRRFGLDEPIPSLRMKAWREGLQVAELLRQLREKHKWTDAQLRAWVGQVCSLDGWLDGADPKPGAPIVTFAGMDGAKLETLKRAALAALCEVP